MIFIKRIVSFLWLNSNCGISLNFPEPFQKILSIFHSHGRECPLAEDLLLPVLLHVELVPVLGHWCTTIGIFHTQSWKCVQHDHLAVPLHSFRISVLHDTHTEEVAATRHINSDVRALRVGWCVRLQRSFRKCSENSTDDLGCFDH